MSKYLYKDIKSAFEYAKKNPESTIDDWFDYTSKVIIKEELEEEKTKNILTYEVEHDNSDFLDFTLSFYIKSEYLGGYMKKMLTISTSEDGKWLNVRNLYANEESTLIDLFSIREKTSSFDLKEYLLETVQIEMDKMSFRRAVEGMYARSKEVKEKGEWTDENE
jgi:hypothetical protein